jgi:hypothetical protein
MSIRRGSGLIGGSFTGESLRPAGYQFPTGLSSGGTLGQTTNVVSYFGAT